MYASSIEDSYTEPNNYIHQKRKQQIHNKSQKNPTRENFDTAKVNSVLEKLHNSSDDDSDDEDNYEDNHADNAPKFGPPNKPQSVGMDRTIAREQMANRLDGNVQTMGTAPQPNYSGSDNLDLNYFNPSPEKERKAAEDYYKRVLPAYLQQNVNKNNANNSYYGNNPNQYQTQQSSYSQPINNDVLLQKLNYMIHLLEEKQDERTNNVTEEVVLYFFIGIFIIFTVDSFARVGKYHR
jgi:hypothetical protein